MNNTTYSNVRRKRVDGGESQAEAATQVAPSATPGPSAAPVPAYDYDQQAEAQPAGLFGTPARAFMLGLSLVALIAVFGAIIFLLMSRNSGTPVASKTQTGSLSVGQVIAGVPVIHDISKTGAVTKGSVPPDFQWTDASSGQKMSLSALHGKTVWINFWGTWCPPCKAEMPEIKKVYDKHKNDLIVLGVSMFPRDNPDLVSQFLGEYNYDWTFIHDGDQQLAVRYQAFNIPMSYFIGSDGTIKAISVGGIQADAMEKLLAEAK
jgi:thiol-disulfide isomerase/thioredoxin